MKNMIITILTLIFAAGSLFAHDHERREIHTRQDWRFHQGHRYHRGHYDHRRHWNGFGWEWLDIWVWDDPYYDYE